MVKLKPTLIAAILFAHSHTSVANTHAASSIAESQQQAIEQGRKALSSDFLGQLKSKAQSYQGAGNPLYADAIEAQALASKETLTNKVEFKILISDAMGEEHLIQLIQSLKHRSDVSFYIQGILPEERTINDVGKRIMRIAAQIGSENIPPINLDPRPFEEVDAEYVPQILAYQNGKLIAQAQGLTNAGWMSEQISEGKRGDFGNFATGVKITERNITEVMKERASKLDKKQLIEEAKARYWKNVEFLHLPVAQEDAVRTFEPSVTANQDLITPDGKVVALAGTSINTLNVRPFTKRLVIYDATNPDEVEFVKGLPESSLATKFITTRFDRNLEWDAVKHAEQDIGARVDQLKPEIVRAFNVRVTPSVITANNKEKVFVIEEYDVRGIGNEK